MRLAVFSDVHGNLEALEAFREDAAAWKVEQYICLGDIVGYGAEPDTCVRRVMALPGIQSVVGNHDRTAATAGPVYDMSPDAGQAIRWTRKRLSPGSRRFLEGMQPTLKAAGMIFAHATPHLPLEWHYTLTRENTFRSFARSREKIIFVGHTHVPQLITKSGFFRIEYESTQEEGAVFSLKNRKRVMVNCGSIGQPRDTDARISYVIYDTERETLIFRRVPYDCGSAAAKIRSAGLPDALASRLFSGI
ncbi:phosphodiesterase [Desulfonema ishimotonii]|uniref:Phosphodiesterase n=1 Tax=Desulfonema ishimotonii TaxID=45657 RepID=A0A401FV25_9BACT|nr:metallophosphoesterase family protein [Desulfonema ishimotonii]GBC60819.1 phosphodiesterase [Desulfonema ishimotonii]